MGITIPATGSGTQTPVVATEVISGNHYQFLKLVDPQVGSLDPFGTSANPIFTRFPALQPVQISSYSSPLLVSVVSQALTNIVGSIGMTQLAGPWTFIGSVFATLPNTPFQNQGDTFHGSADVGFPVKIGGFAVTSSFPSYVNSGARVNAIFDRGGRLLVQPMAPITMRLNKQNDFTGPLSGTVVWSCGLAGGRIVVTDFNVAAGSATAGIVTLFMARSGPPINFTVGSGISIFRAEMAPSATVKPGALKSYTYPEVGDPNDAVRISISTSMQVYVNVGGYEVL
jgi:hypothetical protein